jgi:uncharacterized membrane protein YphA (DoxX/SURF4 family)
MRAVASILSIILFLAFATAGLQKLIFNTMASQTAEHLGFKRSSFQRIGVVEMAGALGVIIGVAARHHSLLALLNEAAAGGLLIAMLVATVVHLRKGDGLKGAAPALALALVCALEIALRLA